MGVDSSRAIGSFVEERQSATDDANVLPLSGESMGSAIRAMTAPGRWSCDSGHLALITDVRNVGPGQPLGSVQALCGAERRFVYRRRLRIATTWRDVRASAGFGAKPGCGGE